MNFVCFVFDVLGVFVICLAYIVKNPSMPAERHHNLRARIYLGCGTGLDRHHAGESKERRCPTTATRARLCTPKACCQTPRRWGSADQSQDQHSSNSTKNRSHPWPLRKPSQEGPVQYPQHGWLRCGAAGARCQNRQRYEQCKRWRTYAQVQAKI